jgi:hypothetical protein
MSITTGHVSGVPPVDVCRAPTIDPTTQYPPPPRMRFDDDVDAVTPKELEVGSSYVFVFGTEDGVWPWGDGVVHGVVDEIRDDGEGTECRLTGATWFHHDAKEWRRFMRAISGAAGTQSAILAPRTTGKYALRFRGSITDSPFAWRTTSCVRRTPFPSLE